MQPAFLKVFYTLKPLLPRRLQMALRRARAQAIFRRTAPPYLGGGFASCASGPFGARSRVLLTHDVETKAGLDRIDEVRAVEEGFGYLSTWNFVLDRYGPVNGHVKRLQEQGCECGAHGLFHDGRLFSGTGTFSARMERIAGMAREMGIRGFRSPSLLHDMTMLSTLDFDWDSSLPAWDPFQPQGSGCGRYTPFFLNGRTLELPVTLWQDFTLYQELRTGSPAVWLAQTEHLLNSGCLVNIIVHPDYFHENVASGYAAFLRFISSRNASVTLPGTLVDLYRNMEDHG